VVSWPCRRTCRAREEKQWWKFGRSATLRLPSMHATSCDAVHRVLLDLLAMTWDADRGGVPCTIKCKDHDVQSHAGVSDVLPIHYVATQRSHFDSGGYIAVTLRLVLLRPTKHCVSAMEKESRGGDTQTCKLCCIHKLHLVDLICCSQTKARLCTVVRQQV
jgi:hypothetical protein